MKQKILVLGFLFLLFTFSCQRKVSGNAIKGYDSQMLNQWVEKIIIPSYQKYFQSASELEKYAKLFEQSPSEENFTYLKQSFQQAYKDFQSTLIFDIGPSVQLDYLELSNTFPTQIDKGISVEGNIELIKQGKTQELVLGRGYKSTYNTQGFPALDYLLYGPNKNLEYYTDNQYARQYIRMLTQTLLDTITKVLGYWQKSSNVQKYYQTSDLSVTGPYNSTISAFIRVYEKQIRADKVGYAAGSIGGQKTPINYFIEAYYQQEISKELLVLALKSSQNFFNGKTSDGQTIKGLKNVLEEQGFQSLARDINAQYEKMYEIINKYQGTLRQMSENDNATMKNLYNAIQGNVFNFKLQMLQALNAQVGYSDTDGD